MKSNKAILLLAPLLLTASGCRVLHALGVNTCHDAQPYMAASSIPPLKIPAGLDAPDTANALRIPPLNEPAPPPRRDKDPCLDAPPPFKTQQAAPPPQA